MASRARLARASLLFALPLVAGPAPRAFAHAILVASTPTVGGTVPAGKLALKLRYNSRIDLHRSRVSIAGPDDTSAKAAHKLPISGTPADDEFDADAALKPGSYVLRWQALALDGHITRGEVPFTAQ